VTLTRLPSLLLDDVVEDFLESTLAEIASVNTGPFSVEDAGVQTVKVDGVPHDVVFDADNYDDPAAIPGDEVAAKIAADLAPHGATAVYEGGVLVLRHLTYGASSTLEVTAQPGVFGGGSTAFDFPTGAVAGTDSGTDTVVVNRVPNPGEDQVPTDSRIDFELVKVGGAVAIADVVVTVDTVVVLTGGSAQAGWSLSSSNPDTETLRVELTPPGAWASDATVAVSATATGFSEQWSFDVEDSTAPDVVTVEARDRAVVRVTWDEPMRMLDATADGDALNPASYLIERVSKPSVALEVVSVVAVDDRTVDLVVEPDPMTFGADYAVVTDGVLDVYGNESAPSPDNFHPFTGYLPDFPEGRRFLISDFVPGMNRSESPDLRLFLAVIQEVTNVLLSDADAWTDILDPLTCSDAMIDEMLLDLGNPFDAAGSLEPEKRRELVTVLVDLYKLVGTAPGIIAALRFFFDIEAAIEVHQLVGWDIGSDDDPDYGDEMGGPYELSDTDPVTMGGGGEGLFSFTVYVPGVVSDELRGLMETVVLRMKAVNETFVRIVDETPQEVIDHLVMGLSEMGGDGPGQGGEFIMH